MVVGVPDGAATATVRTAGPCDVLELSREDFRDFVLPNKQVRGMIEKIATDRLARINAAYETVARERRL